MNLEHVSIVRFRPIGHNWKRGDEIIGVEVIFGLVMHHSLNESMVPDASLGVSISEPITGCNMAYSVNSLYALKTLKKIVNNSRKNHGMKFKKILIERINKQLKREKEALTTLKESMDG